MIVIACTEPRRCGAQPWLGLCATAGTLTALDSYRSEA
jgi:hypothetical protein